MLEAKKNYNVQYTHWVCISLFILYNDVAYTMYISAIVLHCFRTHSVKSYHARIFISVNK